MTNYIISNGHIETIETVAGDTVSVLAGGVSRESSIADGATEYVFSDGQSISDTIDGGASQYVSSGGSDVGAEIFGSQYVYGAASADVVAGSLAYQIVEAGGSAVSATLVGLGHEFVLDGGVTFGTQISSGGVEFVLSGGAANGTTVLASGSAVIATSGSASGVTVDAGGALGGDGILTGENNDAGRVSGVTIPGEPSGVDALYVLAGGSALDVTLIGSDEYMEVESGGWSSNTAVSSGGVVFVDSGGATSDDQVLSGGIEQVNAGGCAYGVTVSAGGVLSGHGALIGSSTAAGAAIYVTVGASFGVDTLNMLSGGAATDLVVSGAGNLLTVDSGAWADSTAVSLSGGIVVAGSAYYTAIYGGGSETVDSGGQSTSAYVASGGLERLLPGAVGVSLDEIAGGVMSGPGTLVSHNSAAGRVIGVTVGDASDHGSLELLSGGVASNVTVTRGANLLQVESGASATGTILVSSGSDKIFGSATRTTVSSGAAENVEPGGVSVSATVLGGGTENLSSGATAKALRVSAGGRLSGPGELIGVDAIYGTATSATVGDGGKEVVVSGGSALDGTVSAGGAEYVRVSGTTTGTTVSVGGDQFVSSGGVANGTRVLSGGSQVVSAGGRDLGATVSSFGTLDVLASGSTTGTVVSAGGEELVSSGGATLGTTVLSGGQARLSGGHAVGLTVSGGGVDYVLAAATTTGTVVGDGGKQIISSGGQAIDTNLSSGGEEYVRASGATTGTTVSSGGDQVVSSGGIASGAVVQNGGLAYVLSGGTALGATIADGGKATISSGGIASGLGLLSGGVLVDDGRLLIAGAGTLAGSLRGAGAIVETGSGDLLLKGADADFSGKAVISGGTIELATAGALGTGAVTFVEPATGSAVLQIDAADGPAAGGSFANTLSNFDGAHEGIDLRSIAFVAGASARVIGSTLVVSEGGKTYKFDLAGGIAGAYRVLSDGHGGTLIGPTLAQFAQAAAVFAPLGCAKTALVPGVASTGQTPFLHVTASGGGGHL